MRTIKFRAWNKLDKCWLNCGLNDIGLVLFINQYTKGKYFYIHDSSKSGTEYIELMQFTGLFDKNEKEIYEGDIVKFLGGIGKIIYFEPYTSFQIEYGKAWISKISKGVNVEIIGNIYENPELINCK